MALVIRAYTQAPYPPRARVELLLGGEAGWTWQHFLAETTLLLLTL